MADLTPEQGDVQGVIARLFVHPVKSCAAVEVQEAWLLDTGLELDRAWMVVDPEGAFVTQRELPLMALIRPQLKTYEMVLRAPGMLALHVAIDEVEAPVSVQVWDDQVKAFDMGAVAAQWFTDFLGRPLRLVRFDPEQQRLSSLKWTGGVAAPNQFSDGFPVLLSSEASVADLNQRLAAAGHAPVGVERFRANVVLGGFDAFDEDRLEDLYIGTEDGPSVLRPVKPCARCPIPDIDPQSAQSSPEVGDTLRGFRSDDRVGGAITFGMNAIVTEGAERIVRVGQPVWGRYRFD
ncbi:MOSC N-terminal beta barrel domain-containing protein [Curvibacter sp. RS43]|uniref:MOSC domain-containing protein n=1 Tax=Curvibacter microcysteis TaxID=3026419 RepID=UPI0023613AEE|nr:MOSC N-terminal beta barrel domain-containing protein [Curvibacter sp. RS43]MDD0812535.1 MOSC N-terminal beta barrel domain-containing protein [Curvibacter sp. RS43]